MISMGMGKRTEVPFSAPIKLSVCRYLSWRAVGDLAMAVAASLRALEAFSSPCAAITFRKEERENVGTSHISKFGEGKQHPMALYKTN